MAKGAKVNVSKTSYKFVKYRPMVQKAVPKSGGKKGR
jgi:hypothetical protein